MRRLLKNFSFKSLSLRARIFSSMLLLILLSFIVIGGFSVYHFSSENKAYHSDRLERKENAVHSSINYMFLEQSFYLTDENIKELFDEKVLQLSKIHSITVSLYNLQGQLLLKAGPMEVPWEMPQDVLKEVLETKTKKAFSSVVDGEELLNMYSLISDANGVPFAVVYLPYQDIKTLQKQDLWEFFDLLIEIYLLIFIGAAELAYLLSRYISSSLETVSAGLKKVRLNQKSEPIAWASNDEIGALIAEYNHMVQELEASAIKLARSERDTAWKEMARLVAHEIKNPLTPMRLQVQHLQKSLPTTATEKLNTFSESMLDQIDTLANIADSFSRFANLPTQQLAYLNMQEMVERAVALHPNLHIKTGPAPKEPCIVLADKDQLVRVLNNLITNAQQAIPEDRTPLIEMRLWCDAKMVFLSITDNGSGIPEDQMDRIFEPSFTTKTKGMGLGLAIVRNILEGVQGQISVTSTPSVGTRFLITLPKKYPQKNENAAPQTH